MKICFLTTPRSAHSHRWVRYFADKGHEIHWISLGVDAEKVTNHTDFHLLKKIPGKPLRPFFYLAGVKNILAKIKPDVFHVHQAWIDGVIGAACGYRPFVLTAWGSDILIGGKARVKRPLIKFALRRADSITCDADHVKQAMVELGAQAEKIHVIYFGTDVNQFCPGPRDQNLIDELEISDSPVVISLRSLRPLYDIGSLVKAAPLVLEAVPGTKFIIVGDGPEKERLERLAHSLGVLSSMRFVGAIPSDTIPEYLRLADVYVSTALSDAGLAASTAEAMSCGLPVVVTDFGDNKKWVDDKVSGFVVPLRAPEDVADRVVGLLLNEDLRHKFGQINRQIINERNNWDIQMSRVHSLYEGLADNRRR